MKTIFALLLTGLTTFAAGQYTRVNILNGQATNEVLYLGTNRVAVLNQIDNGKTLATTTDTNLNGFVQRAVLVPTTYVSVGVSGCATNVAGTADLVLFFQSSLDSTNWSTLTNSHATVTGTNTFYTNFTYTVGEAGYFRCSSLTNASGSLVTNLFLEYYYKP